MEAGKVVFGGHGRLQITQSTKYRNEISVKISLTLVRYYGDLHNSSRVAPELTYPCTKRSLPTCTF